MSNEENAAGGLEDLSQIFAPSWARQDPGEVIATGVRFAHDDDRPPRRFDRDDRRGPRPPRRDDGDDRRGPRPPRRDGGEDRPMRGDRPPRSDKPFDRRPARGDRPSAPRVAAPPPPLAIDVRFMPEGKALAAIVRRIQTTHRAYPFRDIVKLFQKDDAGMAVRIEARKEQGGPDRIFQCRVCGMPSLSEAEVAEHLLKKHLPDYFDVEEVECDPPSGNFPCVARCGLTGELLGPPNHHSFAIRVKEMVADRFQQMGEDEYRRHIEMVRDPEVVEAWREQCRKKTVYRRKVEGREVEGREVEGQKVEGQKVEVQEVERPALDRHDAELLFRREIMPEQIGAATHVVCPATSLKGLPDRRLAAELSARFADETEHRFQPRRQEGDVQQTRQQRMGSLFTAIHAAFHHRGLFFFRAGDERGQEFVMAAQPTPFDLAHATSDLREIVQFVTDHPSCAPKALIEALNPDGDEEKTKKILASIRWLAEKGHVVEFFNGFLSPPTQHPVFKPNPPKPRAAAPAGAKAEERKEHDAGQPAPEAAPHAQTAGDPAASPEPEAQSEAATTEAPVVEEVSQEKPAAADVATEETSQEPASPANEEVPNE